MKLITILFILLSSLSVSSQPKHDFSLSKSEFLLDGNEKVLWRDGKPLSITPKAFELLQILVENLF